MTLEDAPFLFVGNGQYANRGCEAIAKSSIRLIREYYPNAPIVNGNELGDYDQIDETEPDVRHIRCSCMGAAHRKMRIRFSTKRGSWSIFRRREGLFANGRRTAAQCSAWAEIYMV